MSPRAARTHRTATGFRPKPRTHRDWLELVDRDGPFLAIPALKKVYPEGMPPLRDDAKAALRDAKAGADKGSGFDRAWDTMQSVGLDDPARDEALATYRVARDAFVDVVLRDVVGWRENLRWGADAFGAVPPTYTTPRRNAVVEATGAFVRDGAVAALVLVVDPVASLRDPLDDTWAASPVDRLDALLRATSGETGCTVGLVTDGRWWALVSARDGVMTASGVVDAQTWIEEADARDAFTELLSVRRLVGGAEEDRLPAMFAASVTAAEEITVALGTQVRRAVELLVTALSEELVRARADGRPDPLPADRDAVYSGAVTAMMRVVFLLFAEERGMLPATALFAEGYGMVSVLDGLQRRADDEGTEALDATTDTWHRLLATSTALYGGITTENARIPAYGGSLFDPDRYPFLTALDERGALAVTVSDRVMLEVLRSVQYATIGAERRRISFREVDVEQIGYIYEGLLGYTARDVDRVIVGLTGPDGAEPEVPLDVLDDLYEDTGSDSAFASALIAWVKDNQPGAKIKPSTPAGLVRVLAAEPEDSERALIAAVPGDGEDVTALRGRLRPYLGIIRRDLRERPVVIREGGLVVTETPSRKNSGAHYTPKSLAQEVVRYALEPLVYAPGPHQSADASTWVPISSDQILDLKVADIACGSGAFLVAAAEYLADRLVEAWHREQRAFGEPHHLLIQARREVVARCLYGADINAMAVEMCKLSLWLVSLDPTQPFSFVDDKVLHGNSLLGVTDLRQIEALHIDPSQVRTAFGEQATFSTGTLFGSGSEATGIDLLDVRAKVSSLVRKRRALADPIDEASPVRSAKAKDQQWHAYQSEVADLERVADGVIAAGLALGGKKGRTLNDAYGNLRIAVDAAFGPRSDSGALDGIIARGLTPTVETDYDRWQPLHWALAVPDVMERGGFDAIIGNPPFLGGSKLSGAMGANVREYLRQVIADGPGNADLVAYFFLRAMALLQQRGTIGLIATNTIAQGDTREVGLDAMVANGFTITRAIQSRSWPAQSANLEYAAVWGTLGRVGDDVPRVADGTQVWRVTTLLEAAGRVDARPTRLTENRGMAFLGAKVYGMGFVLEPAEAQEWIASDARYSDILFPFLNGEDLNSRPDTSASRWVIDFDERSESVAATYERAFARVVERVKPERAKLMGRNSSGTDRAVNWWKFGRRTPALNRAVAGLEEVLAIALVSKTVMPVRTTSTQVFSHALGVFATDDYGDQAVLSSTLHQLWAITYGSTLETRVRYTPSDVFETFPRPAPTERLTELGRVLDEERREIMQRRGLGLTKVYNLVNDPVVADDRDALRLREIHVEIDEATVAAHGWDDLRLDHGFHSYRQAERFSLGPAARIEVLNRLLAANQERNGAASPPTN